LPPHNPPPTPLFPYTTLFRSSASGMPTECRHGTKSPWLPSASSAPWPMRVMIRMLTATYAESVNCTPTWLLSEPSGPIENGTTRSEEHTSELQSRSDLVCRLL